MRQPKPWYWEKRTAWYVTLDGKQVRLHENEQEAHQEYFRIMAGRGRLTPNQLGQMKVADCVEALCEAFAHRRSKTRENYATYLGPFAAHFRSRRLDSIRSDECMRFVAAYQGRSRDQSRFSASSRHLMLRHIKTLFRWARDMGILPVNPLASLENPWKIAARSRHMTVDEYNKLATDERSNSAFKEFLEILWRTGARPGEIRSLSAKHLDPQLPVARLEPSEHKTGSKTGRPREIIFPEDLMARLREYAKERPDGPLLRNSDGQAWKKDTYGACFRRAKRRLGLPQELCLYMARHAFITRLIDGGAMPAIAAKISGNSIEVISKVYYHPDTVEMLRIVEQSGKVKDTA